MRERGSLRTVGEERREVYGKLEEGRWKFTGSLWVEWGGWEEYLYYHDGVLFFKNVTGFLKRACVVGNVLYNHLHWVN